MDQNWPKVLRFLYSHSEKWEHFGRGDIGITDDHPLVERTGLTTHNVKSSLSFLEKQGLIEEDNTGFFKLTEKGFDVTRQREVQETQVELNRHLLIVTAILAGVALIQAFDILYGRLGDSIYLTIGSVIIGFLGGYLIWAAIEV